jgi:hypothetical protein
MGIIAKTKQVFAGIGVLWSRRRFFGLAAIFLIGLALVCSAAFVLKGTPLLISLIIGGILIIISWGKMAFDTAVKRAIRLEEAEKLEEQNRQLLERESILKQQLEEAGKRKLQLLNVQPILELGILEADCQISRCFDLCIDKNGRLIDEKTEEKPKGLSAIMVALFGQERRRFIGTLTVNFTARYGVDMQSLRIQRNDRSKTISVEGGQPTYLGSKGFPRTVWEGCVALREQTIDETWIADDEAVKIESPCKDICRNWMEEDLKNGPESLEWLKSPLQNTVKHLLQMMIAPEGYSVEFVNKIEGEYIAFFDYAARLGLEKPRLGNTSAGNTPSH